MHLLLWFPFTAKFRLVVVNCLTMGLHMSVQLLLEAFSMLCQDLQFCYKLLSLRVLWGTGLNGGGVSGNSLFTSSRRICFSIVFMRVSHSEAFCLIESAILNTLKEFETTCCVYTSSSRLRSFWLFCIFSMKLSWTSFNSIRCAASASRFSCWKWRLCSKIS